MSFDEEIPPTTNANSFEFEDLKELATLFNSEFRLQKAHKEFKEIKQSTEAKTDSIYAQYINKTNQLLFDSNINTLPTQESNVNDSLDKQFHSSSDYPSQTKFLSLENNVMTRNMKASCDQLIQNGNGIITDKEMKNRRDDSELDKQFYSSSDYPSHKPSFMLNQKFGSELMTTTNYDLLLAKEESRVSCDPANGPDIVGDRKCVELRTPVGQYNALLPLIILMLPPNLIYRKMNQLMTQRIYYQLTTQTIRFIHLLITYQLILLILPI